MNNIILFICCLIVFEVVFLSIICFYSQADFVPRQVNFIQPEKQQPAEFNLASGVVPHHNLALPIIEKFFQTIIKEGMPQTLVILSPDHFNSGFIDNEKVFLTLSPETLAHKDLSVASGLILKLDKTYIDYNNVAISLDHGIFNLLPIIKKYLPKTKILPILVPADLSRAEIINLIDQLKAEPDLFVVASVDFSHYLPQNAADFHDVKSQRILLNFNASDFDKLEVDCWQCLYGARLFASLKNNENYKIIDSKNSADYVGSDINQETTSYFSVLFGNEEFEQTPQLLGKTFLFFGDMMFDRGVKELMRKNSQDYTLLKIRPLLKGVDKVIANLEGPAVANPQDFGDHAMTFNFDAEILPVLQQANFSILSLANNHVLNQSRSGFFETQKLLRQNKIDYFGDPIGCEESSILVKENLVFVGLNKTFPANCSDQEISQLIKNIKSKYPENFVIANMHWGNEYQTVNSKVQQNLAHLMIDNGADLIIGHHPHVVQNIEEYGNKLIFYSLGNFIFDQYFSENTQQGLAVGLELYSDRQVYRIFPIFSKLSQPELMSGEKLKFFLEALAASSSPSLNNQIKDGIIELNY